MSCNNPNKQNLLISAQFINILSERKYIPQQARPPTKRLITYSYSNWAY